MRYRLISALFWLAVAAWAFGLGAAVRLGHWAAACAAVASFLLGFLAFSKLAASAGVRPECAGGHGHTHAGREDDHHGQAGQGG